MTNLATHKPKPPVRPAPACIHVMAIDIVCDATAARPGIQAASTNSQIPNGCPKPFSFGILGGGWYGCHIATSLRALGFRVKLFEQHHRLLNEASGNNQFRLHMGFHYARHSGTRAQSRDGFLRFIERYPDLSREVPLNLYAVPKRDSLLDFPTYRTIMASSGLHFTEAIPKHLDVGLTNVAGVVCTSERVLLISQAREYFEGELKDSLSLNHRVDSVEDLGDSVLINGSERFDFVIDATWGHFEDGQSLTSSLSGSDSSVIYEPTILFYYEGPPEFPALTLVDGPLCSLYPTECPGLFTLSSVSHTPLGQFSTPAEAREVRDSVSPDLEADRRTRMEEQISRYLPSFRDKFHLAGRQLAIKTKIVGADDDRTCHVERRGCLFSVMSGKIDTVFFAVERILSLIEVARAASPQRTRASLRDDVLLASNNNRSGR
jgi:hypothetical protein